MTGHQDAKKKKDNFTQQSPLTQKTPDETQQGRWIQYVFLTGTLLPPVTCILNM